MAEHHELVAEMSHLEQMGTQERQKLAKKRRLQQLKKWGQREKEWIAKEKQLNKRLANMLHEENNGLNLKQYTTYSSNHRSKKKLQLIATGGSNHNNITSSTTSTTNGGNNKSNNNNNNEFLNNNIDIDAVVNGRFRSTTSNGGLIDTSSLAPNGRVHFNVGVMLLEAAARNDFDEVKRLLMLGVSPDSVNHDGLTALHQCCIDASEPMMNLLLEFGANVDARDTEQWTPLHAACTCGHLNLVKILVENGANLLAVNGDGNMPFDICEDEATLDYIESQMVKRGITQEMIDFTRASTEMQMISDLEKQVANGQDINTPTNDNGVTQLHIAAANGYLSVVKFLLKHGVNVNVCDNDLWRPLHGAACWGNEQHAKVIELLVEAGANLNAKTINDETVFDLCDNVELLEKLNQLKDELESKQASGTDRLRRTQSRTNSRVHSVRRTSVRDKNQISRREAREEALLRVENSPTTVGTNNDVSTATAVSRINGVSNCQTEEESINEIAKAGEKSLTQQTPSSAEIPGKTTIDQVDGSNSKSVPINGRANCEQTDLDNNLKLDGHVDQVENSALISSKSQDSSAHTSSNDSIANKRRQQMVKQPQVAIESSPSSKDLSPATTTNTTTTITSQRTNTHNKPAEGQQVVPNAKLQNHGASPLQSQTNVTVTTIALVNDQKAVVTNQVRNTDAQHKNNTNGTTTCDSNMQQQQRLQQITQSMVQLAPINYTLSNLKKQRSDLRMRTTSIGGGCSTNGTTTTTNGHQIVLDPQPTSLPSLNGLHRPESPGLTFRKFRGEPSEVIGGGSGSGGSRRHRCCILI